MSDQINKADRNIVIGLLSTTSRYSGGSVREAEEILTALAGAGYCLVRINPGSFDYAGIENSSDILLELGDNAGKWALAFLQIVTKKRQVIDWEYMVSWFSNAIEHSADVRRWRKEGEEKSSFVDGSADPTS